MSIVPSTAGVWDVLEYASGRSVARFTSFLEASYSLAANVSDLPVEEGGFASYNKTVSPRDIGVKVAADGDPLELQGVIDALDELAGSTTLLSVLTPYAVYGPVNLVSFSYTFARETGACLVADLKLREIRQVAPEYASGAAQPEHYKNPSMAGPVERGRVQPRSLQPGDPAADALTAAPAAQGGGL